MSSTRSAVAIILLCSQFACYGPRRNYSAREDLVESPSKVVKVTLADGRVVELSSPRVVLDSLLTGWDVKDRRAVGFPLTSVQGVTGREFSAGRTTLLLGSIAAVISGVVILLNGSSPPVEEEPD